MGNPKRAAILTADYRVKFSIVNAPRLGASKVQFGDREIVRSKTAAAPSMHCHSTGFDAEFDFKIAVIHDT